ncbi:hypothetical protein ACGFZP_35605 [Kitasatospora sp. NPDC048239]|uniref:hypothetical protein n=1 Tax=Kitasatospora sp. NPDC048239 TaxID=3364046 RepID=UPI00370FB165
MAKIMQADPGQVEFGGALPELVEDPLGPQRRPARAAENQAREPTVRVGGHLDRGLAVGGA